MRLITCSLTLLLLFGVAADGRAQQTANKQQKKPTAVDRGKMFIEESLARTIRGGGLPKFQDPTTADAKPKPIDLPDVTKMVAELPLESLVESANPLHRKITGRMDNELGEKLSNSKTKIELPVESLLVPHQPTGKLARDVADADEVRAVPASVEQKISETTAENPSVEPGLVQWHADFQIACTASKKSGKPVLLFHLLGQLDQRFT